MFCGSITTDAQTDNEPEKHPRWFDKGTVFPDVFWEETSRSEEQSSKSCLSVIMTH